jgi:hypothetical protein
VFFLSSLGLTYLGSMNTPAKDVMEQGVMGNLPKSDAAAPPVQTPAPVPGTPAPATAPAPASEAPKQGEVPK